MIVLQPQTLDLKSLSNSSSSRFPGKPVSRRLDNRLVYHHHCGGQSLDKCVHNPWPMLRRCIQFQVLTQRKVSGNSQHGNDTDNDRDKVHLEQCMCDSTMQSAAVYSDPTELGYGLPIMIQGDEAGCC